MTAPVGSNRCTFCNELKDKNVYSWWVEIQGGATPSVELIYQCIDCKRKEEAHFLEVRNKLVTKEGPLGELEKDD